MGFASLIFVGVGGSNDEEAIETESSMSDAILALSLSSLSFLRAQTRRSLLPCSRCSYHIH